MTDLKDIKKTTPELWKGTDSGEALTIAIIEQAMKNMLNRGYSPYIKLVYSEEYEERVNEASSKQEKEKQKQADR